MKVIFLDIDGVLNTTDTFQENHFFWKKTGIHRPNIDEFRVKILKDIIEEIGAKIVISSTLKSSLTRINNEFVSVDYDRDAIGLLEIFKKYNLEIYDITYKRNTGNRQKEIKRWLENNDVECFVVIDDNTGDLSDFIGKELVKTNYFKKDGIYGLCECHKELVINKLNQKVLIKK